jgi:putative ABC transport system permease protein
MRSLVALARGLVHRAGTAVIILAVAVIATATAAAGPVYYRAAQHSILSDVVSSAPFVGRGYEATLTGSVAGTLSTLQENLSAELDNDIGAAASQRVFAPAVDSIEAATGVQSQVEPFLIVWRTDFCAHLVVTGRCPARANQVAVSQSDARIAGWHIGSQIDAVAWPTLTVTGVYKVPANVTSDYWVLHAQDYFPLEQPQDVRHPSPNLDAIFTSQATMSAAPGALQGTSQVDQTLAGHRLTISDVGPLAAGLTAFTNSVNLAGEQVVVQSSTPGTLAAVKAQWRAVAVPVTVTTTTVLVLSWLLLYLIVAEAVEARGTEIALAKLRGHGWRATLLFGLSEPTVLLLAALPAGTLAGWVGARYLATALLQPGTPVTLPWAAWAAAAATVAGGLAAVIMAAQRALRRGVVEQFRRPSRQAASRGWVLDSILLTGAVAGLAELYSSGQLGSGHNGVLELLVPGLTGLAVAVVASRLLPLGCRALFGVTSRHGSLAPFLALRHIARREGGIRTTIVLATAFSLTAFAFAAYAVAQRNYRLVADTEVGAADVLTVAVPSGRDLGAIVARADPSGHFATAVDAYIGLNGSSGTAGQYTLAVDPARFASVAYWPGGLPARNAAAFAARLHTSAAPPIVLTGDEMRVTVAVTSASLGGEEMYANVTTGSSPVSLGSLPAHGSAALTGSLTGCPCVLQSFGLTLPTARVQFGRSGVQVSGKLSITAIDVHQGGSWRSALPATVLGTAADWLDVTAGQAPRPDVAAGSHGLTWTIAPTDASTDPTLAAASVPSDMPALIAAPLASTGQSVLPGNGLNGAPLQLKTVGVLSALPGAPGNGVIINRQYAELAAGYDLTRATQQVWLAPGALPVIRPKLLASGVRILSVNSTATAIAHLSRQGPALASALFLADAVAAAVLAAGAAIIGLYASARRRRYEYAALEASGIRRRTLHSSLLMELAVVLGFGVLAGAATGLVTARFVLANVPEFTTRPAAPALSYLPPAAQVATLLVVAAAFPLLAALLSSLTLIRGVRADLLRETPA